MKKFHLVLTAALALTGTAFFTHQASASLCPAIGVNGAGCGEVITFGPGGAISTSTTVGPYDGSDDTSVGVINNSGSAISSFGLTSNLDIFGFDGDGIDNYGNDGVVGNATDANSAAEQNTGCSSFAPYTGCYGGPDAYYTNVSANNMSGTVNFITPIADGGSDYFSLEEAVQLTSGNVNPTPVPEPASLILLGSGLFGLGLIRRQRKQG